MGRGCPKGADADDMVSDERRPEGSEPQGFGGPKTINVYEGLSNLNPRRFEYGTSAYEAKVGMWKSIEYLDIR